AQARQKNQHRYRKSNREQQPDEGCRVPCRGATEGERQANQANRGADASDGEIESNGIPGLLPHFTSGAKSRDYARTAHDVKTGSRVTSRRSRAASPRFATRDPVTRDRD